MPEDRLYSVQLSGTQVKVTIASAPKPLVFSYKDGKIEGPGAMDVAGEFRPAARLRPTVSAINLFRSGS
jgi:hypothetical protein